MFTLVSVASSLVERLQAKTPILLITDIGSDPDDILALLVLLASNQLQVGVPMSIVICTMLRQTSLNNCVFNGGARPPCLQLVAGGGDRHHWRGHREQGEGGHQVFEKYQLVITIVIIIIAIVIIVIVLLLLLLLYCYCIVIVIATESRARVAARFFTLGTCIFKEGSRQVFEKMSTCYCGPVYYTELMFQTCHVIFID